MALKPLRWLAAPHLFEAQESYLPAVFMRFWDGVFQIPRECRTSIDLNCNGHEVHEYYTHHIAQYPWHMQNNGFATHVEPKPQNQYWLSHIISPIKLQRFSLIPPGQAVQLFSLFRITPCVTPSRHVHAGRTVLLQGAERRVHGRDVGRGLTATLAS